MKQIDLGQYLFFVVELIDIYFFQGVIIDESIRLKTGSKISVAFMTFSAITTRFQHPL